MTSEPLAVLNKIKSLITANEPQLVSSGFNLILQANDSIWDAYLLSNPECGHIYKCLTLSKQKITPEILEKCWKTCTRVYACGTKYVLSPSLLQDIVSKHLKYVFYSLSKNTPESLTHSVLEFMSSAVLYDSHHANLILSHCNLPHNIYHYMYSHKSPVRSTIVKFVFSFFLTDDYQLIRSVMEHRTVFNKIFRYVKHDSVQLSYFIVAVLAKRVFSVEISKKLKIALFSSTSLVNLLHLLSNEDLVSLEDDPVTYHLRDEGVIDDEIPLCDYVQAFIKILCTSERFGILYTPKQEMVREHKYNNSSILHFLRTIPFQLRICERIENLIIELLQYSPDIVSDYLSDEWYKLAPRIQYEWVHALEFLIKFYESLHIDKLKTTFKPTLFLLKTSNLSALVLPPLTTKLEFNQGLQHKNYLCKYLTTKLLSVLLINVTSFSLMPLDSNPKTTKSDLVESIRYKLPDIMIVLSQIKWTAQINNDQLSVDCEKFGPDIALKYKHLAENTHETFLNLFLKLLLLYQELFPLSLLQANYDVSKLLTEHTAVSDNTLLQIIRIINKSPPGAVKWFGGKIEHSPLVKLVNTFILTKSTSLQSEIEISLEKCGREISHVCVNAELLTIALNILREMLNLSLLFDVDKYIKEIGRNLIVVLRSGELTNAKRLSQPYDINFLIQVLQSVNDVNVNVCVFLEKLWLNFAVNDSADEKYLTITFYFLSKLVMKLGMKQDYLFKYYSTCFKFILQDRDSIMNFPLPCQIIYLRLLKYLSDWCEPNSFAINDLERTEKIINANSIAIQRIHPTSIENSFLSSLDVRAFIRISGLGTSDEFLVDVLKYIPFGFANHFLNATNVYLTKFTNKLHLDEWLIQCSIFSNDHDGVTTSLSTYYTNFLLSMQPLVMLYFDSHELNINLETALDLSRFSFSLLKLSRSINQDGMLALSNLTEYCTSIFIRASKYFNRMENNQLIDSLFKWLKCSNSDHSIQEFRENEAKRIKPSELPDSIVTSILDLIANSDCDKFACLLELLHQLNTIIEHGKDDNIYGDSTHYFDYIRNVTKDIYSELSNAVAISVANSGHITNEQNKIHHNTIISLGSYEDDFEFLKSKYEHTTSNGDMQLLNSGNIKVDKLLPSLLKSYEGTVTMEDQTTLNILTSLETSNEASPLLKPFVWGASVEQYLRQQLTASTHIIQGHNPNDILSNLSSVNLNATIASFPVTRSYDQSFTTQTCKMYDPCFLLPLFSYILAPGVVVDGRKFAEIGCLGVLFRCLSSLSYDVRVSAAHCLERYSAHLVHNSFREKRQMSLLLDITANTLTEEISRIPSIHTSLLAHTIPIMLRPHSELYMLLAKFLLSKPTLNTEEIPLFKTMLLSSSTGHKQEQLWMLNLLTEGALCEDDYKFFKRRHVIPLIFSMCDLCSTDKQICLAIVKFASFVCNIASAWNDLNCYEGMKGWIIVIRSQHRHISESNEKKAMEGCIDEMYSRILC